jgi:hypothetical protein
LLEVITIFLCAAAATASAATFFTEFDSSLTSGDDADAASSVWFFGVFAFLATIGVSYVTREVFVFWGVVVGVGMVGVVVFGFLVYAGYVVVIVGIVSCHVRSEKCYIGKLHFFKEKKIKTQNNNNNKIVIIT